MNKKANISVNKIITIIVMSFCLLFLTAANFFIYPPSAHSFCISHTSTPADEESPAPVEEKSSSKTGLIIQEEYIHELHALELSTFIVLSKHKIPAAEKLQVVHFELDAPPPKA